MNERLVFFDLETGGPDAKRHPIIQIAAIAFNENREVLEGFEFKVQFDERKVKASSLRKNHYLACPRVVNQSLS